MATADNNYHSEVNPLFEGRVDLVEKGPSNKKRNTKLYNARTQKHQANVNHQRKEDHSRCETHVNDNDVIQSEVRRYLLYTMLATAASVPFVQMKDAQAVASESVAEGESTTATQKMSTTDIIKPPLDDRDYKAYTLSNGLRVLLCSDPFTSSAAAAMDVHVGATSDPDDVPGLAHFNEHMLFLGTEKYPKEGDFEAFLSTNGGASNAYTDSENTVYYFKMDGDTNSKVKEALDRFGSFFTSPLFTESATNRELNAIESENAKNLQNDVFRIFQIEKSRVNKQHPMHKFFTGNKATLLDNTKAKNINLRQALLTFYSTYYSSNQMTLAVCGPQSIETLEGYVNESFGQIPNKERDKPEAKWAGIIPPYGKSGDDSIIPSFQHMVQIVPVQDLRQVSLAWPIAFNGADSNLHQMKRFQKPDSFLGHLIGHEGPGSLLSFLKSQGWANGLGCGISEELSDFLILEVTVELTSKGLKNVDKVCESIFSYVEMMKQTPIPNHVLDEVLQLSELEWRFATKGDVGNYATGLANSMQLYPPEQYIAGPRRVALLDSRKKLYDKSKPRTSFGSNADRKACRSILEEFLSYLTVDNVMATTMSKSFVGQTTRKKKWYGTDYNVVEIPSMTLASWSNPPVAKDLGMFYPRPNVFIPTEKGLALKEGVTRESARANKSLEERMQPLEPPHVIRDDGMLDGRWTVHYKKDDRFGLPKVYAIFQVLNNRVYSSAETVALGLLYQLCIDDYLTEYAYDATLAGLSYNIQLLPRGVRLTFGGYNDKLQDFAVYVTTQIVQKISQILPQTDDELERFKDRASRGLAAFDVKQPYSHAIYYSSLLMQPLKFNIPNNEVKKALDVATLQDLQLYSQIIWMDGKGEALVQGNIEQNEVLELVSKLDDVMGFEPFKSYEQIPPRIKALPLAEAPTTTKLFIEEPNKSNNNAASQVTIQCLAFTDRDHVLMELVSAVVSEKFYDDLRTRQQLGYIVSSGLKALEETRMISFIVQSSVAPTEKLTQAILKFIDRFREDHLETLTESDIDVYVKGLLDNKLEPDKALAVETSRNWNEISSGRYQFDRITHEAKALLELRLEDLLLFWDTYFSPTSSKRRMLITEDVPREGPASSSTLPKRSYGYQDNNERTTGFGSVNKNRTIKNNKNQRNEIKLGLDDIALYRQVREREEKDVKNIMLVEVENANAIAAS